MRDARRISAREVSQGVQRHVLCQTTWFGSTVMAQSGAVPLVFDHGDGAVSDVGPPAVPRGPTPVPPARLGQMRLQPGLLVIRRISLSHDGRNDPGTNQSHDPPDRVSRPPGPS